MSNESIYVAIEGVDGAGTTTVSKQVSQALDALWVCEPSRGETGQLIRRVLSGELDMDEEAMMLLFAADRHQLVNKAVRPALQRGVSVVSDRCFLSTLCYQGVHGVPHEAVYRTHSKLLKPDLIILLDVGLEIARDRRKGRGATEIYETARIQRLVHEQYSSWKHSPLPLYWPSIYSVDASGTIEDTVQACLKQCELRLQGPLNRERP